MGQIVGAKAKPKRANLNALSQVGTPALGEYVLVSSDNSMNAAGQGNFDCYIVGDGTTSARRLALKKIESVSSVQSSQYDLELQDEDGNVLVLFANGEVKVKNFDSADAATSTTDNSIADLKIADESGNVLVEFKGGHIRTKNFSSESFDNNNKFYGKKVAFLGDSITQQAYYVNFFQTISGCIALNYGRGGSHIAKPISSDTTAFEVRYSSMDDNADFVVVFGGTNDFGHSSVYRYNNMETAPFGTFGDGTNESIVSFYAGLHRLFKGLSLKYDGKPIYIVTPIHHGVSVDSPEFIIDANGSFTEGLNANTNKTFKEYVEAIKEVAAFYSIQVIDAYSYSRLNPAVIASYFSDGLHLSSTGGNYFGKWLFEQMLKY